MTQYIDEAAGDAALPTFVSIVTANSPPAGVGREINTFIELDFSSNIVPRYLYQRHEYDQLE